MAIKSVNSRQCALGQSGLGCMSGMAAGDQDAGTRLQEDRRRGRREHRLSTASDGNRKHREPGDEGKFTLVVMNGVNTVHKL
jgi:hypothetical protein